ncbi:MAG: FecR domain-containing protein [Bacteroidota bacterium]
MLNKWIQHWRQGGEKPNGKDIDQEELVRLEQIWRAADPPESDLEVDVEAAWATVEDKLFGQPSIEQPSPLRMIYSQRLFWAAAAIIGLVIGAWWITNTSQNSELDWTVALNTNAEPMQLELPDGSQVWLNSGSQLSYLKTFESRQTQLVGEAFFDVVRDPLNPFTITTGEVETRVLGTSFNIRAYADKAVEVSVATGRVAVEAADQQVELEPGQAVTYQAKERVLETVKTTSAEPAIWREETVSLGNGESLSTIAELLTNYFGRPFVLNNSSLVDCRLGPGEEVIASRVDGPDTALEDLNFFLYDGLVFQQTADTIFISGSCSSQ